MSDFDLSFSGGLLVTALCLCVLQVEVLYGDEPLKDYYTLMDIAYFYEWRRVSGTFQTLYVSSCERTRQPDARVVGSNSDVCSFVGTCVRVH